MSTNTESTHRILVVDDNQDSVNALARVLKTAGYVVQTAFDGPTAIALAARFHPELCILDINMPGMDGYELARHLRAQAPQNPPILATMTACDGDQHFDRAAEAGFDLHFPKVINLQDMFEQLATSLRRH